ncbi:MAG: TetR/AcrR family transcriptional regulator [Treponema sp.]|nr:TetR/AcrR family transcriptional regulator [Treponema sp.]
MAKKAVSAQGIVEAALFSAFKNGMGGVSLADIALELGIKKASLYNYFAGKEEILAALCSYCSDFYARVNFFDQEIFTKINSTNCEKLFKKAVDSYIKAHEAEPLFQIYTLVASEKYFDKNFYDICETQKKKIFDQSFLFFKIASAQTRGSEQKSDEELRLYSDFFTDGIITRLDFYIAQKKETIRRNPECDAGSLFALPSDEKQIAGIVAFALEILRRVI